MSSLKVLAAAVAFNEEKKIVSVYERFQGVTDVHKKILIDDGSTDRTPDVIRAMGVEVISHPKRLGVGAAIRTAIHYARKNGFDVLVILAGNDKDRPTEIGRLLKPIEEGFDFVQGSRYLKGGEFGKMPAYRRLTTQWVHPILFSTICGRRITDSTNGFRAFRLSLFEDKRFKIEERWLDQYELEPYIFFKAIKLGYKVGEVPVTKIYPPKALGYTKMKPFSGWWSILRPIVLLGLGLKK